MLMTVVCIRIMRVLMPHGFVAVLVDVWGSGYWIMLVLMVSIIMDVSVGVLHRLVFVFVLMAFGEVEPDPESHESSGDQKANRYRFAEKRNCNNCPNEGGDGKIRPGPSSA